MTASTIRRIRSSQPSSSPPPRSRSESQPIGPHHTTAPGQRRWGTMAMGMAKILIIDDNETIREGLAHTIKKLGHEVATAANGAAGLDIFKAKRADFVITDLKMEGAT